MEKDTRIYWIWLAELLGQGSRIAAKLVNLYGNAEAVYHTSREDLLAREELTFSEKTTIRRVFPNDDLSRAARIVADCDSRKINVTTPDMPDFPKSLTALVDMPLVLYYRGKIPNSASHLMISVVGTRTMSPYGRKMAYTLGYGLSLGGTIVVSGMALGTDAMAMAGALDAGSPTVAVLGSGVDVIYPHEHDELYYRILRSGAVISEYPPGSEPAGRHFPVRNRLISGLSEGTVVVEGNAKSGALITARLAQEQGKKVFAVPGKIGEPGAEGPLQLIRNHALPAVTAEDILEEFSFYYPDSTNVNFVHSRMRNVDFDDISQAAMGKLRIGTRGESNTYGRGVNGGRLKDYKKAQEGARKQNHAIPAEESEKNILSKHDFQPSDTSRNAGGTTVETVEWPAIRETLLRKNMDKREKTMTVSEERKNKTTGFALNMLDETDLKVYNSMQPSVPVTADDLAAEGIDIGDVMAALSTLELAALVESAPGGYFTRISDALPVTLHDDSEN